jgi:cytochrome c553
MITRNCTGACDRAAAVAGRSDWKKGRCKMRTLRRPVLGAVLALAALGSVAGMQVAERSNSVARFTEQGELVRPRDYRTWIFVGAPLTPNDMNNGHAAFPEFHNVYLDPGSYEQYKARGEFRDGAVIVKELVSVGSKAAPSGKGYFEGEYLGVEAMVKSKERFADQPGHWGFFRFTDEEAAAQGRLGSLKRVASVNKAAACASCHAAGRQDYVFTQYYPVLRAAVNAKGNPENR